MAFASAKVDSCTHANLQIWKCNHKLHVQTHRHTWILLTLLIVAFKKAQTLIMIHRNQGQHGPSAIGPTCEKQTSKRRIRAFTTSHALSLF